MSDYRNTASPITGDYTNFDKLASRNSTGKQQTRKKKKTHKQQAQTL